MNFLGIAPNILYKSFITNPDLMQKIEIDEKISELEPDKIEYSIIDGQNEEGLKLIKECQNLRLIVYMGNLQEISLDEGFRCKYKDCAVKDGRLTDIYWMEKTDVIRK